MIRSAEDAITLHNRLNEAFQEAGYCDRGWIAQIGLDKEGYAVDIGIAHGCELPDQKLRDAMTRSAQGIAQDIDFEEAGEYAPAFIQMFESGGLPARGTRAFYHAVLK